MAAALVLPNSGPYTGTWNALVLGTLSDDGYSISATPQGQEINETDSYGLTLVEAIYRGINWRARFRGLEFKSGLLGALLAFGSTAAQPGGAGFGTLNPTLANIGDRWSKYGAALVLTAILANPPTSPQSLTASTAILAPGQNTEMMFTSKVKEVPIEMVLLPYAFVINSVTYNLPFSVT